MIIGTAGHIDHGKSSLMRALTGVDTDRLPEEKRRGISIELGYAFLDRPDGGRIAFVDVPGHEKLIHTMVSGATGFDHALLIVAADDGVMPQTREHAAILQLLGLRSLTLVITKIDRVDSERVDFVRQEAFDLLADIDTLQTHVVSSVTGQGIDALRTCLLGLQPRQHDDVSTVGSTDPLLARRAFRMPLDRSFSLAGTGTVVAGTVHHGVVNTDDELALNGDAQHRIRVRGIHANNQTVSQAGPGTRCAVNLAATDRESCPRGAWLVAPHLAQSSLRMDVELTLHAGEAQALKSGTWVHVHIGTCELMASLAVLFSQTADALQPGETGIVQLVFKQPVSAWWGDRFLLRDASASRTVAGGRVLDCEAPVRYRRTPQRHALLQSLQTADTASRLLQVVQCAVGGLAADALDRTQGLVGGESQRLLQVAVDTGQIRALSVPGQKTVWLISTEAADRLQVCAVDALQAYHTRSPDELGPDPARLRRIAAPRLVDGVWSGLLADWIAQGFIVRQGAQLLLPGHATRLSDSDRVVTEKAMPMLLEGGFDPPWVRDVATEIREAEMIVRMVFARQASAGKMFQVVKDLFYPLATMAKLAGIARRIAAEHGEVLAAEFRDATGLGRKRAIQILEYFDRIGVLRRVGDRHLLRADCNLFVSD